MTATGPTRTFKIFVSAREWSILQDIRRFALDSDERTPESHFLLECAGENRVWSGGNGRVEIAYRTTGHALAQASAADRIAVPIHSRFFPWDAPEDLCLLVHVAEGEASQTMTGLGFDLTLPEPPRRERSWRVNAAALAGQRLTVEREALERAAAHASCVPLGASKEGETAAYIGIRDNLLEIHAPWPELGGTTATIPIQEPVRDTHPVLIHPLTLALLAARSSDDFLTVLVPRQAADKLAVITSEFEAILTPIDRFVGSRHRLHTLLNELLATEVSPDEDGDYQVVTHSGNHVWVRLKTTWRPLAIQVFGILATEVEQTEQVMNEVNLINTNSGYVRVMVHDGQVVATIELLEHDVGHSELKNAIDLVATTVDNYQALFTSYFTKTDDPPQLPGI